MAVVSFVFTAFLIPSQPWKFRAVVQFDNPLAFPLPGVDTDVDTIIRISLRVYAEHPSLCCTSLGVYVPILPLLPVGSFDVH
ncbi:hypothetical protein FN846DRAFT_357321 [Sphaerosporella brunnea]|uniref:Uncharacterized protein n=1 Tax=Sphaerosporella brunnea TaxID=1250544 RepID=A0A5J5EJF3_9PEZI|nr:hypothetical protein FN846DRAFT_357321 [Sphaerosporella brunnea]